MSKIPYFVSKHISDELKWPNEFYSILFKILTEYNGLWFAMCKIRTEKIIKSNLAYFIISHLIYRTLQFEKVFEFLKAREIIDGIPTSAIPEYGLSRSTVKRVLNWMSPPYFDFFIKLRFERNGKKIITPLYGLNVPDLLNLIQTFWLNSIDIKELEKDNPSMQPSNMMLRGRCLLECCIKFANEYKNVFDFLSKQKKPIKNIESFLNQLRKHLPNGNYHVKTFEEDIKTCWKMRELRKMYREAFEEGKCFEDCIF